MFADHDVKPGRALARRVVRRSSAGPAGGCRDRLPVVPDRLADRARRARDPGQARRRVPRGQHLLLHRPRSAVPLLQHPDLGAWPSSRPSPAASQSVAETHETAFSLADVAPATVDGAWVSQREPFQASASERKVPPLLYVPTASQESAAVQEMPFSPANDPPAGTGTGRITHDEPFQTSENRPLLSLPTARQACAAGQATAFSTPPPAAAREPAGSSTPSRSSARPAGRGAGALRGLADRRARRGARARHRGQVTVSWRRRGPAAWPASRRCRSSDRRPGRSRCRSACAADRHAPVRAAALHAVQVVQSAAFGTVRSGPVRPVPGLRVPAEALSGNR